MSSTQLAQCINSVSRATPKQFPNLRKAEISGEVVRSIFCSKCKTAWRSNAVLASSNHPLKKQENTGKWEWVCTQRWQDGPLQGLEHKAQAPFQAACSTTAQCCFMKQCPGETPRVSHLHSEPSDSRTKLTTKQKSNQERVFSSSVSGSAPPCLVDSSDSRS